MVKFPQLQRNVIDKTVLSVGNIPFAKHNIIRKSSGHQIGFLTEHTLFFIIKGEKRFHFDNNIVSVKDNELILMKRGVYTISEQLSAEGVFEALMLFIPEKLLRTIVSDFEEVPNSPANDYVIIRKNPMISNFQNAYLSLFDNKLLKIDLLLALKLKEIFLLLANTDQRERIVGLLRSSITMSSIDIEFIVKDNIFKPLTVPDFAKLCARSLASFKRDFEHIFHNSPKKWIKEQRVKHGNRLLKSTSNSVSDVALACGFESTTHFIKAYKEHFNTTPGKARAKQAIF